MTDPNEIKRRASLNRALSKVKLMSRDRRTIIYIVKHGKWAYRLTDKLPRKQTDLVFWSNNGE
jgi:hypothetical protein